MANKYQSLILEKIRDYLNANKTALEIPKITIDELSTQKDSLSMGIENGAGSTEQIADCTGTAIAGTIQVSFVYRVMQTMSGNEDMTYTTLLDNIFNFLRTNYKSISINNAFIDSVSQNQGAVLSQVYQGGVKDYKTIIIVTYERST